MYFNLIRLILWIIQTYYITNLQKIIIKVYGHNLDSSLYYFGVHSEDIITPTIYKLQKKTHDFIKKNKIVKEHVKELPRNCCCIFRLICWMIDWLIIDHCFKLCDHYFDNIKDKNMFTTNKQTCRLKSATVRSIWTNVLQRWKFTAVQKISSIWYFITLGPNRLFSSVSTFMSSLTATRYIIDSAVKLCPGTDHQLSLRTNSCSLRYAACFLVHTVILLL